MLKFTQLAHLLLFFSLSFSAVPFATYNSEVVTRSPIDQTWVPQDLSGFYVGRVYFGDKTGNQMIMSGPARLQILANGKEFILTHLSTRKIVRGKISTAVAKDRPDLRAGEIEAVNDSKMDIRWSRDKARNRLKIVRASGVNRVFRFCTQNINREDCKTDL